MIHNFDELWAGGGLVVARRTLFRLGILAGTAYGLGACGSPEDDVAYDPNMQPRKYSVDWGQMQGQLPPLQWQAITAGEAPTDNSPSRGPSRLVAVAAPEGRMRTRLGDQMRGAGVSVITQREDGPIYAADITGFMGRVSYEGVDEALQGIAIAIGAAAGRVSLLRRNLETPYSAAIGDIQVGVYQTETPWPRELVETPRALEPAPSW